MDERSGGGARIIVVEEPQLRRALRIILERHGYDVAETTSEAFQSYLNDPNRQVQLLITGDPECAEVHLGEVPVLCLLATPDRRTRSRCALWHCRTLQKPFSISELLGAVEQSIRLFGRART